MANIENNADKNPIVSEMIRLFMESFKNRQKKEQNNLIKKYENKKGEPEKTTLDDITICLFCNKKNENLKE